MNTVLVLLLLATAASAWNVSQTIRERWIRDTSPYYSKCMCASGAEITAATNVLGKLEFPNNPCLKCFIKCIHIEMGLMLSDGTIVLDAWVQVVAGVTLENARNCTNKTNHMLDGCEKAYEWAICLVEAVAQ